MDHSHPRYRAHEERVIVRWLGGGLMAKLIALLYRKGVLTKQEMLGFLTTLDDDSLDQKVRESVDEEEKVRAGS